ncbi:24489_t:CDS:2 [Gigaspora margarita]|uniref:24489_t:CDS:1 n=1 Tax=Gigaspora margarita TaxID=4874 RepID=A0ABM8W446_GIGMA|nr:24489_t:CDS:2 [Gigaspora margarita]
MVKFIYLIQNFSESTKFWPQPFRFIHFSHRNFQDLDINSRHIFYVASNFPITDDGETITLSDSRLMGYKEYKFFYTLTDNTQSRISNDENINTSKNENEETKH